MDAGQELEVSGCWQDTGKGCDSQVLGLKERQPNDHRGINSVDVGNWVMRVADMGHVDSPSLVASTVDVRLRLANLESRAFRVKSSCST